MIAQTGPAATVGFQMERCDCERWWCLVGRLCYDLPGMLTANMHNGLQDQQLGFCLDTMLE